jgi:hypothetical protein
MGCVKLGVMQIGGCSENPSLNVKIDVDKVSRQVASSIQNSLNEENTNVVLTQNQNVSVKGSCCNPLKISQEASMTVINTSKMDIKMVTDIADTFKKDMITEAEGALPALKNLLGQEIGTRLSVNLKTAITNVTESSNFKKNIQKKMNETFASQGQNIVIDCGENMRTPPPPVEVGIPDTGCYISQKFLLEQVSNNIMETLMSDILDDPAMQEVLTDISKKNIEVDIIRRSGFEKQEFSWWNNNKKIMIIVFLFFLIPLVVKIFFG